MIDDDAVLAAHGAALVAAHPGPDLRPAIAGAFGHAPLGRRGEEARPEERQRGLAVLVLRSLRLAAHREPGGPVGHHHAALGLVAVLSACARAPAGDHRDVAGR